MRVNALNEWPDESEERRLLSELQSGLPTAKEDATVLFLPLLACFLRGTHRHVDPELCDTVAADAVFDFVRAPERYDREQLRLGAYLKMAGKRDLMNLLDKERRCRRGIPLGSVAEPADRRNEPLFAYLCDARKTWPTLSAIWATLNGLAMKCMPSMSISRLSCSSA